MGDISRRNFIKGLCAVSALGLTGCVSEYNAANDEVQASQKKKEEQREKVDFDYLLCNGIIIDGTGRKPFKGDVALKNGRIAAVGDFIPGQGGETISAENLIISPGFIDLHTHTEDYLQADGKADIMLLQGVTTHIGGNCGSSLDDIGGYFESLGEIGINSGMFVGLKNLRLNSAGTKKGNLTASELKAMKEELQKGMQQGAFGLSVGLQYWPQVYTTTEEVIELCKVAADAGGFYSTHIRSESDRVISAVKEAIQIGFEAGLPVEYSHIKTSEKTNWGEMARVLELVEEANVKGLDITADVYGYEYSSLDIGTGRSSIKEEDMMRALKHPLVMVGSDSGLDKDGRATHPRAYGNYPRILGRYIRDKGVISLKEGIKKMTSMPASRLNLQDRGILQEGKIADIAVFDNTKIIDKAVRSAPNQFSEGMQYVFVNGKKAVADGQATGVRAGCKLKRNKV